MIKKFYYISEYYIYYTVLPDFVDYQASFVEHDTFGAPFLRDELVDSSTYTRRLVFSLAPTILGIIGPGYTPSHDWITGIVIPASITQIAAESLWGCENLSSITYQSTMGNWNNVTKGTEWNEYVPATVVHCTDGDVTL